MKFKWIEEIKVKFVDVVKEYLFSIAIFLVATVLWTIQGDGISNSYIIKTIIPFLKLLLYGIVPGVLLCETIYHYHGYFEKKKTIIYAVIIPVSVVITYYYAWVNVLLESSLKENIENAELLTETAFDIFVCYLVTAVGLSVYFIYKRSGECFETYVAKAFCGMMKALLVYGIIDLGILLVLLIFDALIIETSSIDLIMRCEIMLVGLVAYPCSLMGISKTENDFSKFSKIVLAYIFTGLLAIAFFIIYLYIFKIVFTWQFPKNQVFSILTALFLFGIVIWTMASGCCQERFLKPIRIMPFLFIPFIVLQIMCLYMRVADYGFTRSRYFGLAFIVFEILYFAMYCIDFFSAEDITFSLIFIIIAMTFIVLVVPFTNYKSVVLMSQKHRLEKYFAAISKGEDFEKNVAFEAYKTIRWESGYVGNKYLEDNYSKEQLEELKNGSENEYDNKSDNFYIYAYRDVDSLDVEEYKEICFVDCFISSDKTNQVQLETTSGDYVGTADLSEIIDKLVDLEEADINDDNRKREIISQNVKVNPKGNFIITEVKVTGEFDAGTMINSIDIKGYVLR
ncbi:protein of unknown function [Butyrivibrio proteoclasticus]|uniref:DUF4153 domain-containing protein n=1 Tax=Butyrivibrio proteoclasticus TaxID=43305 RepID=A0A1I5U9S0_9FIRM|nr:protein of unknown function [Butyrivibrio proteoclasticus]